MIDANIVKLVVPKESAVMDESRRAVGLPLDHSSLNKFREADNNYNLIVKELVDIIQPLRGPVHVVPKRRIAPYQARRKISEGIDHFLSTNINGSTKVKPLVLHGLGGIGKTQLVLDYINRNNKRYNPILWINAESTATIKSSFERCAKEMHLDLSNAQSGEGSLSENPSIKDLCDFLGEQDETSEQWLMVFDNADHEKSFDIVQILPRGPCANIIVTSRHPHLAQFPQDKCERIHVKSMNHEESRQLMLSHFFPQDRPEPSDYVHIVYPATEQLLDETTELLGHFPLAIDLAARYMVAENFGLAPPENETVIQQALRKYIDHFRDHKTEILNRPDRSSEYNDNIRTVWDITLQSIERNNPDHYIGDLLALFALMDRWCIEDGMFYRASKNFMTFFDDHAKVNSDMPHQLNRFVSKNSRGDWDDYYYSTAKNKLIQYGLLELLDEKQIGGSSTTTMHSLVQWRAKQRIQGTSWGSWLLIFFASIAEDIAQAGDTDTPFTGQFCRTLYFSLESMQPFEQISTVSSTTTLLAWYVVAVVLREERMYEAAHLIATNILTAAKSFCSRDDLFTIHCKKFLASIHEYRYTREDLMTAQAIRAEICTDYQTIYGQVHDSTIEAYTRLALLSRGLGSLEEAKKIFRLVIMLRTELHGMDHPDTLQAYCSYALTLHAQRKGEKAEQILKDVYEFQSRKLGPTHPDTIPTRNDLFHVLRGLRRYEDSQIILEGLIEQFRQTHPPDHEIILQYMRSLQLLNRVQGRTEEAEKLGTKIAILRSEKKERLSRGITDSRWIGE